MPISPRRRSLAILVVSCLALNFSRVPPVHAQPDAPAAATSDQLVDVLTTLFSRAAPPAARIAALSSPVLADARAKAPLVFLLADPEPEMRAGAVRALARFLPDQQVETSLIVEVLLRRNEVQPVRLAAIAALAGGSDRVAEPLFRVFSDDDNDLVVRSAAKDVLGRRFPALLAGHASTEVVDRRGRLMLTIGGAALGSYGLAAVGGLGRNEAGITIGGLGGALVGAGTAFFLTRSGEISPAQAGWVVSGGLWGAGLGMLVAGSVAENPSQRVVLSLGLLGETLGVGLSAATRKTMPFNGGDVLTIDLAGLAAVDLAAGALMLGPPDGDASTARAILLGAGSVGLVGGALVTRRLHFTGGDAPLTIETAYEGAWVGWLAAHAADAPSEKVTGAQTLGLGLGFLGGAALAQFTDYQPADVGLMFLAGSYGKLLGASIPLLADAGDEKVAAGALAGGLVSLAGAHLVAPRASFAPGAGPFVGFSTALGLWHGVALGQTAGLDGGRAAGAVLLGASAAGLVAMPAAAWLRPTGYQTAALAGGAFWGSWFSAWGLALTDADERTSFGYTLAASDAGLIASGLLISPAVAVDPRRMGIANLGGLTGAAIGSLGAALAAKDRDIVITGNLAGSAAGLVFGSILAANLELRPLQPEVEDVAGASLWRRALARVSRAQVVPLVRPGQPAPDGRSGAAFGMGLLFAEQR